MAPPSELEMKKFAEYLDREDIILRGDYHGALLNRFPVEEDQARFLDWHYKRGREALRAKDKRLESLCPTPGKYLDLIAQLDFWNEDARIKLVKIINNPVKAPGVFLGRSGKFAYRMIPTTEHLVPHKELDDDDSRDQVGPSVLGVNLNVEAVRPSENSSRSRRKMNLTDQSDISNSSAEMDTAGEGFIFQQLGELECSVDLQPSKKTITEKELLKVEYWKQSGFGVVVEIKKDTGRAGAVYIVFNFFPMDEIEGDRYHQDVESLWGRLPPHSGKIGLAKIADSVRELNFKHEIELEEVRDYEIELVPVLRTNHGAFIRATVAAGKSDDAVEAITAGMGSLDYR